MEALERKVGAAKMLLQQLSQRLQESPSDTTAYYCAKAIGLLEQSMETRSTIGIFGATGAGKSSLMNAILDEESLLPTNCMRACTAVVTEISYNSSDIPYKATIEFISKTAWERELGILLKDIIDDDGKFSSDCNKNNTDAALAYSKLRAVYPGVTKAQLTTSSAKQLMAHKVINQLDTVISIEENDPIQFHNNLRLYIDSRDRRQQRKNASKQVDDGEQEVWPLIRVVRLYLKCDVLKHGVVLVDLPGVHDSNAARAAVAKDYQKQCDAFFVVSTIIRAADDMSAKTLLSDAFKRQLKLDGRCSNVTFICTQTDNISLTEMSRDPEISDRLVGIHQTIEECEVSIASLKKEQSSLQKSFSTVRRELELVDRKTANLKASSEPAKQGELISKSADTSPSPKRRRDSPFLESRKRLRLTNATGVAIKVEEPDDGELEAPTGLIPSYDEILPDEEVGVEPHKVLLQKEKNSILEKINVNHMLLDEHTNERRMLKQKVAQICIAARNTYSRQTIQQTLAMEIKALDQQAAEQEDPENFDPNVALRDYEELANGFAVFCVSSRAYQKLHGRLPKEKAVQGFSSVKDTELPQLQAHCSSAAKNLRMATLEKYMTGFDDFCRSLKLWDCNSYGLAIKSASNNDVEAFSNSFTEHCETAIGRITNDINIHFLSKIPEAVWAAQNEAVPISARWGKPVNMRDREKGGLHWQTYRAVVLRDGCYANQNGAHDFNHELTAPLINRLMHNWDTVFFKLIPSTFEKILAGFETFLKGTLAGIQSICHDQSMRGNLTQLLEQQFQGYLVKAKHLFATAYASILTRQREINRSFEPVIVKNMLQTYAECAAETGRGMFVRMRNDMDRGVSEGQTHMYHTSANLVQDMLNDMLETTTRQLKDHALELCKDIKQDCIGHQTIKDRKLEDLLKPVKKDVAQMIREYEQKSQTEDDDEDPGSDHEGSVASDHQSEDFENDYEESDSDHEGSIASDQQSEEFDNDFEASHSESEDNGPETVEDEDTFDDPLPMSKEHRSLYVSQHGDDFDTDILEY